MKVSKTKGGSFAAGKVTEGCELCIEGRKLVLFVTGLCNQNCYYCSISQGRWQKDEVWANERRVEKPEDIIEEAKLCGAKGAGITGGEPLMVVDRVCDYIRLLKKEFGKGFHIHMYTNGTLATDDVLRKLNEAGLDELRIHLDRTAVERALKLAGWKVGMEVPCIPGKEKELCGLVDFLAATGAHFLNLNELEFSERNVEPMLKLGLTLKADSLTAVRGSDRTALAVLQHALGKRLPAHFCTARLKLDCQLRNRLINRASNVKRPFEKVTPDGFLLKGVMEGDGAEAELKRLGVKEFFLNRERGRAEFSADIAKRIAKKAKLRVAIVEEYPTANPWDFELTPLN
ncbi:MAG: radical SAM protein [Candidatus Aenigmatarchaeota archaeon]